MAEFEDATDQDADQDADQDWAGGSTLTERTHGPARNPVKSFLRVSRLGADLFIERTS